MNANGGTNHRECPVCRTGYELSTLYFKNNIDPKRLSSHSFASRKTPEFMAHRLVQCPVCDLVYASQPPSNDELSRAYHVADYDSADEAADAAAAYMLAMRPVLQGIANKGRALEIGTGTGVLLDHLQRAGFLEVIGVEPSSAAIAAAPEYRKAWIRQGMFDEHDFEPQSFDLICCFMTLEHVRDPKAIADSVFRMLRPGGIFVTVTHNYRSLVNRLLGRRSPIIDIEHMQIFSDKSIHYLFDTTGLETVSVKTFTNTYTLGYWVRLSPLPEFAKTFAIQLLNFAGWGVCRLGVNVGNTITAGTKPALRN